MTQRRCLLRGALATAAAALLSRNALAASSVTEVRPVSGFDEIEWRTAGEMWVTQSARERLTIEAEPAVQRLLTTEVRQRRLVIGVGPGSFTTRLPIRFRIETPSLRVFSSHGSGDAHIGAWTGERFLLVVGGSGDVVIDSLKAELLDVRLSGSGGSEVRAGQVTTQTVALSGSGSHVAFGLSSARVDVRASGSGSAQVFASERLMARISGSGDIEYRGRPALTQQVSGSGRVNRVEP